jgi:hypothetical protein
MAGPTSGCTGLDEPVADGRREWGSDDACRADDAARATDAAWIAYFTGSTFGADYGCGVRPTARRSSTPRILGGEHQRR